MAQFDFRRGLLRNLPAAVEDGVIWYAYDTGDVFIDCRDTRRQINKIPTELAQMIADENHKTVSAEQIEAWMGAVEKLDTIESGAQRNVQIDWKAIAGDGMILNKPFYYDTTENWNKLTDLISEEGSYYVYTDYLVKDGLKYPNLKIGDGKAYVVDLPFIAVNEQQLLSHVNNQEIHITQAEREFWNNKVTSYVAATDPENLVLTKLMV
jgi:hypothetical protein